MHFEQIEFAAIDFESTGPGPDGGDEAIQVGIALMKGGEISQKENLRRFIAPAQPRPISHAAKGVHRISEADLAGAPSLVELWPEIQARLAGKTLVAHGAGTEKRFLRAFPLHGFGPWLDTLQIARKTLPKAGDHSLSALIETAGLAPEIAAICPQFGWHDALYDAVGSLVLLRFLVRECEVQEDPLGALGA